MQLKQLVKLKKVNLVIALIRIAADELGNTPTVCRSYYVHPAIMGIIESKSLPNKMYEDAGMMQSGLTASEKEAMKHI